MGLLDDAIRDHLELKRRRGADAGEIAREEREALEPVFPDEPRPDGFDDEPQAAPLLDEAAPHGDPLAGPGPHGEEIHPLGQETVEIDMDAVLAADDGHRPDAPLAGDGHSPDTPLAHEATVDDELLEWEMPDRSAEPPPEPLPGQERLSFE